MSMGSIRARAGAGPSSSSSSATQMPPGVKFSPTEGELMGYYLYNHIRRTLPPAHYSAIRCHDLYGDDDPWEIWRRLQSSVEEPGDVYAFTELKKKLKSGGGVNKRATRKVGRSGGNWHGEDNGTLFKLVRRARSPTEQDERWVGTRKRFSYRNPNPQFASEDSKWILHQFSMRRDDGREDDENEVVCMIRNNGSPTGNAIKEAARGLVLAGRKRKLEDYIRRFSSSSSSDDASASTSSSKRVCYSNSAPKQSLQQQQQQQPPLPFTVFDCSNQVPPLPSTVSDCSNQVLPQKPQCPEPVQEEELDELDITSRIDFDVQDWEFDWGDQGCGGADPQSVLEFQEYKDYHTSTTTQEAAIADYSEPPAAAAAVPVDDGEWKTEQEETSAAAPCMLPPPQPLAADCFEAAEAAAAANPAVKEEEGDAGEEKMVAAAAAADAGDDAPDGKGKGIVTVADGNRQGAASLRHEKIVLPWDVCDHPVEKRQGFDPAFCGLDDLLDLPLSFQFPHSYGFEQQVYPYQGGDGFEDPSFSDLWGHGPM
ncbi:unnamed protein product [Linum trigynum]|uniref:NAC domain-containing protein n=1 Tax=Linum trigynum TaxID=586398 RepID=A0AAV2DG83_9ROSI